MQKLQCHPTIILPLSPLLLRFAPLRLELLLCIDGRHLDISSSVYHQHDSTDAIDPALMHSSRQCEQVLKLAVLRKLQDAMTSISTPTSKTPRLPRRSDSCCSWSCEGTART